MDKMKALAEISGDGTKRMLRAPRWQREEPAQESCGPQDPAQQESFEFQVPLLEGLSTEMTVDHEWPYNEFLGQMDGEEDPPGKTIFSTPPSSGIRSEDRLEFSTDSSFTNAPWGQEATSDIAWDVSGCMEEPLYPAHTEEEASFDFNLDFNLDFKGSPHAHGACDQEATSDIAWDVLWSMMMEADSDEVGGVSVCDHHVEFDCE